MRWTWPRARGTCWRLAGGRVECSLAELGPLEIRQVRRTSEEAFFGRLLQSHHYLRYTQPVGEHLKHLVYARGRPVACLARAPRRATWGRGIGSSAGRRRNGGPTCTW